MGIDYRYAPVNGWGFEASAEFRSSECDDLAPVRTEDPITLRAGTSR